MATFRSLADLVATTQDDLLPGLIDIAKKNDEFAAMLFADAVVTDRPTITGNRMVSAGSASYVGCDDTLTPEAISGAPFSYDLMTIARSFDACLTGQNLYSSFTGVVESELKGAMKALAELVAKDAYAGDGSGKIAGLETQTTNSFAVAGGDTLSALDRAYDEVLSRENLAFVGTPAAVRTVVKELRDLGNLTYVEMSGTGLRVPSYLGIPLVRNVNGSAGTLTLVDRNQFKLFVGENQSSNIGGLFGMEAVGALETKLRKRWHLYGHFAAVLLDTQGAVKITSVA